MADLIQMLIEVLRIDCNVVQCYYTNQIDAIFNLFFFPTVFILLIIYLLLQYILDEVRGGLRLLISIALYAVIVLNGLMTLFIPLSQFWWLVLIIIFGAWVFFFRLLFRDKKGGGKAGLVGFMSGTAGGVAAGFLSDLTKGDKSARLKEIEQKIDVLTEIADNAKREGKSPGDASYAGFTTQFRSQESNVRALMQSYFTDYYGGNIKLALNTDSGFKKQERRFTKIIEDFND